MWPCMEYCFHVWAIAPICYLDMVDKLQKWVCRTVGPTLATSLEHLGHRRNVTSLICSQPDIALTIFNLFYRYYGVDVQLN